MAIELSKETTKTLLTSIQQFFARHLDEEVGELKAMLVLDFCLREIGPTIYNRAIQDAQAYFQDKVTDLDGSCFEPEMQFWKQK